MSIAEVRIGQRVRVSLQGPFDGATCRVVAIVRHKTPALVELEAPMVASGPLASFFAEELEPVA